MSVYTTVSTGPRRSEDLDGPEEFHVVLVDNGRAAMLGGEFREMLRCIRCGACLNHCPVYHAVGGHAYGWVYTGPMGSVLTPLIVGLDKALPPPERLHPQRALRGDVPDEHPLAVHAAKAPRARLRARARQPDLAPRARRVGVPRAPPGPLPSPHRGGDGGHGMARAAARRLPPAPPRGGLDGGARPPRAGGRDVPAGVAPAGGGADEGGGTGAGPRRGPRRNPSRPGRVGVPEAGARGAHLRPRGARSPVRRR